MAESSENAARELRTEVVSVTLGPKGIAIDESGRLRFVNPEILLAIIAARPADLAAAAPEGTNYVACGANMYQCGKARLAEVAVAEVTE